MANICEYSVRVKGTEKATRMIVASMPSIEEIDVAYSAGTEADYERFFTGSCKWSVNFGVTDEWDGSRPDLNAMSDSDIDREGQDYWGYSLRAKSEVFSCDIMVHYWSEESGFDQYDHYQNGKVVKRRKIAYSYEEENVFDWIREEFEGHEGEYDESVDGEEQDRLFMERMTGAFSALGGSPNKADAEEEDPSMEELLSDLKELEESLKAFAEEQGIDLGSHPIGETGFDIYHWTFTEGKRASGDGWTIAIPDGFHLLDPDEKTTSQFGDKIQRAFEAIPQDYHGDYNTVPVHIMSSFQNKEPNDLQKSNWCCHPEARAGFAMVLAKGLAESMENMLGLDVDDIQAGGSDGLCYYTLIQDTTGGSYSYQCTVFFRKIEQRFRVQTQYMSEEQRATLDRSVDAWLRTIRLTDGKLLENEKAIIDDPNCVEELLHGRRKLLDDAVDQAATEFAVTLKGQLAAIEFRAKHGHLDNMERARAEMILNSGMRVKEFYMKKFDRVLDELRDRGASPTTRMLAYDALEPFFEHTTSISLNHDPVTISVPREVEDILSKWKKDSEDIKKAADEQKRQEAARKKAAKERKRAEEEAKQQSEAREKQEYEARLREWKREKAEIENKRKNAMAKKLEEKREQRRKDLKSAYARDKADASEKAIALEKELSDARQKLDALGLFKFSEKRQMKEVFEQRSQLLTNVRNRLEKIETDYKEGMDGVLHITSLSASECAAVDREFPIPAEPMKPQSVIKAEKEAAEKERERKEQEEREARTQKANKLKERIIDFLASVPYATTREVMSVIDTDSIQYATMLLTQLLHEGIIKRTTMDGLTVYYL